MRTLADEYAEEIINLRAELEEKHRLNLDYANELLRLRAELAAAQKDAERYRWIRNGELAGNIVSMYFGDALDPEIDAAIEEDRNKP